VRGRERKGEREEFIYMMNVIRYDTIRHVSAAGDHCRVGKKRRGEGIEKER
jgi:hypothetical protein